MPTRASSSVPDPASALQASREYATHPHLAGSIEDYTDATVILKLFQDELGIIAPPETPVFPAGSPESRAAILDIHKLHKPTAWIDKYFPVMNTPLDRSLSILGEDGEPEWEADLVEDGDPRDPEAAKYRDHVPTFHGLSADGDVTGEVVYVNYGRKEDYDEILANGGNLTGKIALARYGGVFRGLKVGSCLYVAASRPPTEHTNGAGRSNGPRSSAQLACSSTTTHATTARSQSRTAMPPILRVPRATRLPSSVVACSSSLCILVTQRLLACLRTRTRRVRRERTFPRSPVCQSRAITLAGC